MKKFAFAILASVTLFSSCNNDDDDNSQPSQSTFLPMATGNEWKYRTDVMFIENGDSSNSSSYENWKVTKDTLFSGSMAHVISKEYLYGNPVQVSNRNDYYKNTSTGYFGVATNDAGGTKIFLRLSNKDLPAKLLRHEFSNLKTFQNGLFVASPPLHLLKYPVVENEPWASNEFGTVTAVTREYLGTSNITVPAGTFSCTNLRITIPGSFDTTYIHQYFASGKGLIKEERIISGNGTSGPVAGHKITELQSINF
ncbi:MAG: hypothetical protein EOO01_12980 [Chitinophagaceae bacterium]|nr:MAG: hypothetical protein EOO01_12980 [Chitinophagaceae bacterium]